ncbi:hypothetical protein F2Q68_00003544 [Brassica cretica]|uniref:Uncharacterized protein n=1 Tax=Brassica cretica TaxID=69181 RepID=A0A8S9JCH8_BRACR|nr:hypothetical protein F2Q68_00003544 [Brassica cretica]
MGNPCMLVFDMSMSGLTVPGHLGATFGKVTAPSSIKGRQVCAFAGTPGLPPTP